MNVILYIILIWVSGTFSFNRVYENNEVEKIYRNSYLKNQYYLNENSCLNCHSKLVEKEFKHSVAKNNCSNCHSSNGKEHPLEGIKGFTLSQSIPGQCYSCHNEVKENIGKSSVIHKAVLDEKNCINCHSPHSSSDKGLLIKNEKALCLSCHNKSYSSKSSKTKNIKLIFKRNKFVHKPAEGSCTICHDSHASNYSSLLNKKLPEGEYAQASKENFALCFSCHNSDIIEISISDKLTNFRNGNENMHFVHIQGKKGRNCKICHNVHASKNEQLIRDRVSYGNWEMNMNFVSSENGGSCNSGCHAEKKYDRVNKYINNPDFNIANIKKYKDYVDENKKIEEKKDTLTTNLADIQNETNKKEVNEAKLVVENKSKKEDNVVNESSKNREEKLINTSNSMQEKTDEKKIVANNITDKQKETNKKDIKVEKELVKNIIDKQEKVIVKKEVNIKGKLTKEKINKEVKSITKNEVLTNKKKEIRKSKKLLKDTCVLASLNFRIVDYKSGRNLHADIKNGEIEIINEGVQYFKYRVIYYVFSSLDNDRVPVVRIFEGRVAYRVLKVLENAVIGSKYIFEEIIVVDPSGIKLENEVRSIIIERIN